MRGLQDEIIRTRPVRNSTKFGLVAVRAFGLLIAAYCFIFSLTCVYRYAVPIPFWDEWDFINYVREVSTGQMSWLNAALVRSGEHQLSAQLAYSAVGWELSHMHLRLVMLWNEILAGLFCLLAGLVTVREMGRSSVVGWLALAAASFFVFDPAGYQTMLWALAPIYTLLSLAFFIGAYVAGSQLGVGIKILVIGLLCLFVSFDLGNGLLFWLILPAILMIYEPRHQILQQRAALRVFGFLLGLTVAGYIAGSVHYVIHHMGYRKIFPCVHWKLCLCIDVTTAGTARGSRWGTGPLDFCRRCCDMPPA